MFVIDHLMYGGAQKMIAFLANNLNKKSFTSTIYLKNGSSKIFYELRSDVQIIYGCKHEIRYLRRFLEIKDLIQCIKETRPDILISFLNMPNIISCIAGSCCNVPVIISERGDPSRNHSLMDKLIRQIENISSGVVFQTEGAKRIYPKHLQNKSIIIPNPVLNLGNLHYQFDKTYNKIAFVARFELIQKRQDLAIQAFSKVLRFYPNMKLYFYGDGKDEEQCKDIVKELNINDSVVFCGKVENPLEKLLDSYMFLLTSDYEGIPNALIEAMSLGIPVISTDCSPGGAAQLIENNKNGILVPRDNVNRLVEAMIFLIKNPQKAQEYGENAKMISDVYSESNIINRWESYIVKIVRKNKT